jgi:hypothetical protein
VPAGSDDVVIPKAGLMVIVKSFVTLWNAESITVTVNLKVPVFSGVPLMVPSTLLSVSLAGSVPPVRSQP